MSRSTDPLAGSAWSAPGTVAGFAQSPPNLVLMTFAEHELRCIPGDMYAERRKITVNGNEAASVIDAEELTATRTLHLSDSSELCRRLHWRSSPGRVRASLAVTGGVYTALDVVKATMAGAYVIFGEG